MITGNKGEWSEVYTLLKIIADKNLYPGDSSLQKVESIIYPIIKVLRDESNGTFQFEYDDDLVLVSSESFEEIRIPITQFQKQASFLLNKIKEACSATFSIPEVEEFINSFNCHSLKAKSSVKSDIRIIIHDQRTQMSPELGFSIKSQLGGASTILNAGKTTNFVYKINGSCLSEQEIVDINSINSRSKIKDRIEKLIEYGCKLDFVNTEQTIFYNNLILIDSLLPQIIAEIVFKFYTSNLSKVTDLVNSVENSNPLNFDKSNNHQFYTYKIKRFLTDVALGMMPSKVWSGEYDATGGYLIVKEDGDVLCYHIYNKNEFENYLVHNTKLETASSTRHDFGTLYKDNGILFINLNLQIRFLK